LLGEDELEVVATIKCYVEQRDSEKAFIHARDELFTGKMVLRYLVKKADRVEWKKMWNESYPGKSMTQMVTSIDSEYQKVKSYIEAKAKFDNLLGGGDDEDS
jgi:ribosomal protein S1